MHAMMPAGSPALAGITETGKLGMGKRFWVAPIAAFAVLAILAVLVLGLVIGFGTSDPPPVMRSIREGTMKLDRADMPRLSFFTARDGILFAYRMYPAFTRA